MKLKKGTFGVIPKCLLEGLDCQSQVVLMWLWLFANDDGRCFPSIRVLSEKTQLSEKTVKRRLDYLCELGLLVRTNQKRKNGADSSNLYEVLVKDIDEGRGSQSRGGGGQGVGGRGSQLPPILTKSNVTKSSSNIYIEIFNFWNTQEIRKHKELKSNFEKAIKRALKEYSEEEIKTAIKKYSTALKDSKYYYSHTFNLDDFLNRALPKFHESPLEDFIKFNQSKPEEPSNPYQGYSVF